MKFKIMSKQATDAPAGASVEYALKPIAIRGFVIPSRELGPEGWKRGFRLACAGGIQYVIEAGTKWQGLLSRYEWEEVKVIGLLNEAKMAIILQNLFPVGPNGSGLSVTEYAARGLRRIAKKVFGEPGGVVPGHAFSQG